jgi:hypothetical protein
LKEFEKSNQKILEDIVKKRQTKVVAYRKSKMPMGPSGLKSTQGGGLEEIDFLKGIK